MGEGHATDRRRRNLGTDRHQMAEVDYNLISRLVERFDPEYPAASIAVLLTEAWKLGYHQGQKDAGVILNGILSGNA